MLTSAQRETLQALAQNSQPLSLRRRAQILLAYDEGLPTREVAARVGLSRGRVRYYRREFLSKGMQLFALSAEQAITNRAPAAEETEPIAPSGDAEAAALQTPPKQAERGFPGMDRFLPIAQELQSPGVQPGDTLAEAGRKVLYYHFAQMLLHEEGTKLGEDIEELHDMRVATRRMRAAIDVFGEAFQEKRLRAHLKGLRATGRALGKVRDLDVFMEKAAVYRDAQPVERREGLVPLLASWEREREQARLEMLAYLDSEQYRTFRNRFYKFLTTPGAGVRPVQAGTPHLVAEVAPLLIYTRLAAVQAYSQILDSASLEQLHALRIEFKKLRYTVEFFREILGETVKEVIRDLKTCQDHLGDLNDAHIATQILRDFLGEWDHQQDSLPVGERFNPDGILDYLASRYAERHRLMITFHQTWDHFNRPEFRQNLAAAVAVL